MSIWSSMSNAVQASFNTITDVAETAQETVSMATEFVHNRAKEQSLTDKQAVIVRTAQTLTVLQKELEADEKLNAMYEKLSTDW